MEEVLRSKLLATAAVSALVGARVDWGIRSQGATMPAVVLHQVSGVPQMNLAGPSGWSSDRIQVDCWGRTFKSARDLADAVSTALHGLRETLSGIRVRIFVIGRRSDDDSDDVGPVFRTSLDLMVWHAP